MMEKCRMLRLNESPLLQSSVVGRPSSGSQILKAVFVVVAATFLGAACRPGVEAVRTGTGEPARQAPQEATAPFVLPEDLEVTLWAASPMFANPTNIDVDAKGRLWVTEAMSYRTFKEGHPSRPEGDRVVILEDTDGDGVADASKVFVQDEDLHAPLGLAVIGSQVIVSNSPSVIVYTDVDGDDRPDEKEVFLTGFGGYDHDHGLHAVVAGPDGRWYFNAGNAGPHIVTDRAGWTLRSGSIYNGGAPSVTENRPGLVSDDGRIWTGGLALRVEPDGTGLEVLAHNFRNAYELALDSYGNLWQNDNDDEMVATRTTWVMEGASTGYFGGGGTRTWQADRRPGQDLFTAHWHQEDPGVLPAGDRVGAGAPTGIVVYEGDALGKPYRGMLFSADAGRNVVFGYRTAPQGAGYRLERTDFFSSVGGTTGDYVWNDDVQDDLSKWFRPSDIAVGTDGALYVADWYDPIVGGHAMRDRQGQGRIYRITPRGERLEAPRIDLSTVAGQIQALLSPAVNVRNAGFVRLQEQGAVVLPQVKALLGRENPYHRARAVWLLAQLGPEGVREVRRLLEDPRPEMRITAFRALRQVVPDVLPLARRLVRDPSPAVRREVAIALRGVPLARSRDLILDLAEGYDGRDRWYLEALGMAAEGKEEALYGLLRQRLGGRDPAGWDDRFAGIVWRLHPKGALHDLKARAGSPEVSESERERALVALGFIDDPSAAQAVADLTHSALPDVARRASWWLAYRKTNAWHGYTVEGAAETASPTAAVAAPERLRLRDLLQDETRSVEERADAAALLAEDPAGGALLIAILSEGETSGNVGNIIRRTIFDNPDRYVRVLAEQFFPRASGAWQVEDVMARDGDAAQGQRVFYARCASCHRVGEVGGEVGPDLSHVRSKFDREGLLNAIIDPSEDLAHGYEPNVVVTKGGDAFFGFVLSEGPTMVFQGPDGRRHAVERDRIERIRPLRVSIMPRPAVLEMSAQEVADVAAFLGAQR